MAIPGLSLTSVTTFRGKDTTSNLASQSLGTLLAAENCLILSDGNVRRAPGYSLVTQLPSPSPVTSIYEFARSVDTQLFRFYQQGTTVLAANADGSNLRQVATLASPAALEWTQNAFVAYASNGVDALRFVDVGGTITAYQWGLTRPSATLTVAFSPGTLTLLYGRRYVIAPVAKYTDSLGIQRVHVGAPSPLSAHTGPQSAVAVTVSGWTVPADPQQNFWWVFATGDSPADTSSTYYFAAEITAATLAWADTLPDAALDQTRLAPFDNYPAPPSAIVLQSGFQGAAILISGSQVRYSGGPTVLLGIPQESFPLSSFYNLPGGSRSATAVTTLNDGNLLAISNGDTWFGITGFDGTTFTERDRIASPGQAGPLAGTQTPWGWCFLSPSKRLWLWDGASTPTELSSNVAYDLVTTLGMESITDPATARLHWYSFGQRHFLIVASRSDVATPASPGLDWLSLWGVPGDGISGANSLLPTDRFPSDYFTATGDVHEGGLTPFVYAGTADGRILRFPDTFLDAGTAYPSRFSHAWIAPVDGRARFFWLDIYLDCSDRAAMALLGNPANVLTLSVIVSEMAEDSRDILASAISLPLAPIPVPTSSSAYALRASLQLPGAATGRYLRWNLALAPPSATVPFDIVVQKVTLASSVVYRGVA